MSSEDGLTVVHELTETQRKVLTSAMEKVAQCGMVVNAAQENLAASEDNVRDLLEVMTNLPGVIVRINLKEGTLLGPDEDS